jgi:hypothetical protein
MTLVPQQQQALATYIALMGEARARLAWIDFFVSGKSALDNVIARECAYLQIRLTCELVALSCLVAHGDIAETQAPKLQKQWSASVIFAELERLHPDFFPNPRRLVSRGPGHWHFDFVTHNYLNREQFVQLYGRTGDSLHRGNLKNIVSGKDARTSNLEEVKAEGEALRGLLWIHEMPLVSGDRFVCLMENAEGEVQALVGLRDGGGS